MTLDFSRSSPPCAGPLNIALLDGGRVLLCRAQTCLHRRPRQRRLSRADRLRHPGHDAARRDGAEARRRLHRDDPARHRRRLRRARQGRAGARHRRAVRHHQRAVARRPSRRRLALGDVLASSAAASAATRSCDGLNHGNNPISTATIPPAEILEASYPVMFTQWALRPDQRGRRDASRRPRRDLRDRGAGRERRGGVPARRARQVRAVRRRRRRRRRRSTASSTTHRRERHDAAAGLEGDRRAASDSGQRVRLETPGGGGFGDPPTERDPARVARDVRLGYVSASQARELYGYEEPGS